MIKPIFDTVWAMSEEGLKWLLTVSDLDANALSSMAGRKPSNTYKSTIRNGIGLVHVHGPLFKKSNFFTDLFGATAYDQLIQDIHTLAHSPEVTAIVLDIDSPGGEANGIAELSEAVYQLRGRLPIHAYIGGTGASAAYWLASAADQVHASDTAIIGSIGVQTAIRTGKSPSEIKFISAQSPNKNRDPSTDAGAAEIQRVINELAAVFIDRVARNRGLTPEEVQNNYGQGSVFVGASALKQGLADNLTTFEELMTRLEGVSPKQLTIETVRDNHPEIAEHFISVGSSKVSDHVSTAVADERKRITEIQKLCQGKTSQEFCQTLIEAGLSVEKASHEILTKGLIPKKNGIELLKETEQSLILPSSKPEPSSEMDVLNEHLKIAKTLGIPVRV